VYTFKRVYTHIPTRLIFAGTVSQCIIFGRPFVKQFALCYQTLSVLSVYNVGVLWPNGWIKVKLGMQVGLEPGHIVLDGDPVPHPQFSAHICCGQMAEWIKMPLGTEVGLGPGHIVLDGDSAPPPPKRGTAPQFSANVYCGQTAG